MLRTTIILSLVCVGAVVFGNPAANTEWRWETRMPTKTANPRRMSFHNFAQTVAKKPRVAGTKLVPGCGPLAISPKIVGGEEAGAGAYPWQVALFFDDTWFCGGSIISDEYILTAAHCTDGASVVEIVAGARDLSQNEPSQVTVTSRDMTLHVNYDATRLTDDISLIKLSSPMSFNEYIAPLCLPSYSDSALPAGTGVTASGWGQDSDDSEGITDVLREVSMPVFDQQDCRDIYGESVIDSTICTDTALGRGTCKGDSGGPLYQEVGGVAYSRGVTSFVYRFGCEAGYPAGFARTISYLAWIETNTGIAIDA